MEENDHIKEINELNEINEKNEINGKNEINEINQINQINEKNSFHILKLCVRNVHIDVSPYVAQHIPFLIYFLNKEPMMSLN